MAIRIGIDNGAKGALVAIDQNRQVIEALSMPVIDIGVARKRKNPKPHQTKSYKGTKNVLDMPRISKFFKEMQALDPDVFVVLEHAQPFPKEGGATSFNSGRSFGAIEMAMVVLGIPYQTLGPKTWQKVILKGIEGTDSKARSVLFCRRQYPTIDLMPGAKRKPLDGLADAACMAEIALQTIPVGVASLFVEVETPKGKRSKPPKPVTKG